MGFGILLDTTQTSTNSQTHDSAQTFTLTSVAASVNGTAQYTGTITGGAGNVYAGFRFVVTGFTGSNNGTFVCTASSATILTLANTAATVQSASGTAVSSTANQQMGAGKAWFAGQLLVVAYAWFNNGIGAANTGDVTSVLDSNNNVYTRLFTTVYTTSTTSGKCGLSVWTTTNANTAYVQNGGTIQANAAISPGAPYTNQNGTMFALTPIFSSTPDTNSTAATGATTSVSSNGVTPVQPSDGLLFFVANNSTFSLNASPTINGTGGVATLITIQNGGATHIPIWYFPFVGQGFSTNTAPFAITATASGTADWVSVLSAIQGGGAGAFASEFEASQGYFQPYQEQFFQGFMFFGGYSGVPWLKNVFMMPRDYWDSARSTPYSGQLFPTGGNQGGPGQVYPY